MNESHLNSPESEVRRVSERVLRLARLRRQIERLDARGCDTAVRVGRRCVDMLCDGLRRDHGIDIVGTPVET